MKRLLFFIIIAFLPGFILKAQNSLTPIDSAMIACFPFSGNANDQSGFNNNGVVNGALLTADRFNNANSAYSFNGSNQNITVPNFGNQINGQEVSISFWATSNVYATRSAFLFVPDVPSNRFNVHIYYGNMASNSQTFWDFGDISNNGRLYIAGSFLPPTNTWDHWVFVTSQTGSYQKCYKNGVLQLNKAGSSTYSNSSPKDLLIGGGLGVGSAFLWFNGKLDDIRIYKRVLTQNDVTNLYNNNIMCSCPVVGTPTNTTDQFSQPICIGKSTTLTAAASPTINWYSSPSSTISLGTGTNYVTPSYSAAGIYTLYAKSVSNCSTSAATAFVFTVNPSPTVQVSASNSLICFGQVTNLIAGGAVNYTWNPGSSMGSSITVSPASNTTYTVNGVDANGCVNTTYYTVYVQNCNGLNNIHQQIFLCNIYPNPANETLNVELIGGKETSATLEITDIRGSMIMRTDHSFTKQKKTQVINISDLAKGVYYIRVFSKTGAESRTKFIKD